MKYIIIIIAIAVAGWFFLGGGTKDEAYDHYVIFSDLMNDKKHFNAFPVAAPDSQAGDLTIIRQAGRNVMDITVTQVKRTVLSRIESGSSVEFEIQQDTWTVPSNSPPAYPDWKVTQSVVMVPSVDERFKWQVETYEEEWKPLYLK